ncbi:MAG: sugar ABC transporter permease [Alphaproteobacteria bacterium]
MVEGLTRGSSFFRRHARRRPWLVFLLPSLCVLGLIAGWPLLRTIYFSFTDARLMNLSQARLVGLQNYAYLWQDPLWWQVIRNTLTFTTISVFLETIFGLILACVLKQNFTGRGALRAVVLIPWAIPTVVSAQIWAWMYHDIYGIINHLLVSIGVLNQGVAWLGGGKISLTAAILADVWKTTPFMALLLLAGLQMIPQDYYEAAKIDGVHPLKVFYKITLPLLKPVLIVAIIFRLLDSLRIFDLIFILTSNASDTMSLSIYARQQTFDFQHMGIGSAASTCLFVCVSCVAVFYLLINTQERPHARPKY